MSIFKFLKYFYAYNLIASGSVLAFGFIFKEGRWRGVKFSLILEYTRGH